MKNNKLVKLMVGALTSVLLMGSLVGCGSSEGDAEAKNVIVMGTNAAFPPFEEIVGDEIVGFDIEIAKLVAAELGAELIIQDMEFGQLLGAVDTGKIDFIAAGMTATEERAQQVDFSEAYFQSKQVIIVNEGTEGVATAEDLQGKTVGVQLGTTGDLFVTGTDGLEVVQYDKAALAVADLKNGKIDAVIVDEQPAKLIAQNQTGVTVLEAPFIQEEYALAVKKGDAELLATINKVLDDIVANGTYDALYEEYFGSIE